MAALFATRLAETTIATSKSPPVSLTCTIVDFRDKVLTVDREVPGEVLVSILTSLRKDEAPTLEGKPL